MIKIRQYNNKWRLEIEDEEWEVENLNELKLLMETLLDFKEKYGQVNDRYGFNRK